MTNLPMPPSNMSYMVQLVRAIEQELDQRPRLIDGAVLVSDDTPLRIMTPDRATYTVGIVNGALTATPDD